MASFELTLRTRWLRERGAPIFPRVDAGGDAVTERGAGRRGGTTASPPRTLGAGRAVVVGRVAGLPAELGRGEEPLDQPREGEPIGRVVGDGRLVTGRVLLGREVVLGRVVVGRDVVGRLVTPGRTLEGRLVPMERGREVVGRVTGRDVDGRLVGRVVEGRLVGREVLGRDCGLEVGRDGRLVGRDGRLVGRLVGRLWGREGRLVWPLVRWAAAAPGALPVVAEGAAEAGLATAGLPSSAKAMSPATTGVRRSRREKRRLVRSVMEIGDGESDVSLPPKGVPTASSEPIGG
ncbi:MAG: hypothetical protein VXZ39_04285 [Planctomycetota bacterium]|nr:hypothetical protein [Planctomycetota bacterium]MEC8511841.1 hypothetical protein [Planctomycetota bacterium]